MAGKIRLGYKLTGATFLESLQNLCGLVKLFREETNEDTFTTKIKKLCNIQQITKYTRMFNLLLSPNQAYYN